MERQTQTAFSLFMLTLCKRIPALKPTWARWLTLAEKGELILVLKLQSKLNIIIALSLLLVYIPILTIHQNVFLLKSTLPSKGL